MYVQERFGIAANATAHIKAPCLNAVNEVCMDNLYFPMGVKTDYEFFTGFGKKELLQALVGLLFVGLASFLFWLVTHNTVYTLILILAGTAGSVMMTTKDQNNLSAVLMVIDMLRYMRGQKRYGYEYKHEWGEV